MEKGAWKDTTRRGDWPLVEDDRDAYHRRAEARTPFAGRARHRFSAARAPR
jgi:hypothetical protein